MSLPTKVVERDHHLEDAASRSQEQLAELRWHWTLDESNPGRVSFREYAGDVGRSERTIRNMAHGYAAWSGADDIVRTRSLTDEIELAKMGTISQAATEAVAQATGKTIGNIAGNHRAEIKATVRDAQDGRPLSRERMAYLSGYAEGWTDRK